MHRVIGSNFRLLIALVALSLLALNARARLPDATPPIFQFRPAIDVYPQNFAIEIDREERVFLGNSEGVLIYDGEYWQLVSLPNGDIVRSLAFDGESRVYVGGYDAFGYLERRITGEFDYIDLTSRFREALGHELFADIWHIKVATNAVYFVGLEHLFRFEPTNGNHSLLRHAGSFGPIEEFQGKIILQFRGEGFKNYVDGQWQLIEGTDLGTNSGTNSGTSLGTSLGTSPVNIEGADKNADRNADKRSGETPDYSRIFVSKLGVLDENRMIIINPEDTWHLYDGQTFEPLPQFDNLPHKGAITNARVIDSNNLVLVTQEGKVVYLNIATEEHNVIDVGNGFLPDVALSKTGNTLIVDDLGFHAVSWPARWKSLGKSAGLLGTINQVITHDDKTYLLSSSGAFISTQQHPGFIKLDWTDYEAWKLLILPDSTMLFADSYEISLFKPAASTVNDSNISDSNAIDNQTIDNQTIDNQTTARELLASRFHPGRIYVGTEFGIQILEQRGDTFKTVFRDDSMDNLRVTNIIEQSADTILIGSERGGVRQLKIVESQSTTEGESGRKTDAKNELRLFSTPAKGINYGEGSLLGYLYQFDERIIASTNAGFFTLEKDSFVPFKLGRLNEIKPDGALMLSQVNGQQWAYTHNRLFRKNGDWHEEDVSALRQGALTSISDANGTTVVGSLGTLLVFDAQLAQKESHSLPLTISSATVSTGKDEQVRALPLDNISISSANSRLRVRYALADFNDPNAINYRTRLRPSETQFSPWSPASEQSFVALTPNDYSLEIQAQDSHGRISEIIVPVEIRPQWHETLWSRAVTLIALMLMLYLCTYLFVQRRNRMLAIERARLESMVSERTRALESANQQLDKMAHLDGLTQIPNRRRLDSYLTDVWRQCAERSRVLAIAIIDVDHFKNYNDERGHQAGDQLLIELAQLLSRNLRRAEDLVARYGGEEFLVVLPGADEQAAMQVIDDMRRAVEDSSLDVTVSAGVYCTTPNSESSVSEIIELADTALYSAKEAGRNRVFKAA